MDTLIPMQQEIMLEFRAGKMIMDGTRVVPDTRKGLVRIARGEEGLVHFQWLDRTRNVVEDDQIIFPDEAVFEKISESSGRVFLLKFNTDNRRFFFWMQEPKADGDHQICVSVNHHMNQPLDVAGEGEPEASVPLPELSDDVAEDDISSRAGNLVDLNFGAEGTSEVTSSSGPVRLEDLQRILSNIAPAGAAEDLDGGLGLGDILKPDLILPLIETLHLEQQLASYLPEGQWTPEDLLELLQSPPFRQQVEAFTYVLRTGEVDLSQFGIDPSKYKLSVLSFLEALDDSVAKVSDSDDTELPSQMPSGSDAMDESH
ncbi:hypothetical protein IFM89_018989 [Coptis chinensis]|uniref:Regulatory particle non-ATPase 13 n=1 Tax=Coptis chinensis TaxID=261450 RepID=A0A835IC99_9MAGN|nr:hypothetical protein IFM89_018989 [Coptis chinensis]